MTERVDEQQRPASQEAVAYIAYVVGLTIAGAVVFPLFRADFWPDVGMLPGAVLDRLLAFAPLSALLAILLVVFAVVLPRLWLPTSDHRPNWLTRLRTRLRGDRTEEDYLQAERTALRAMALLLLFVAWFVGYSTGLADIGLLAFIFVIAAFFPDLALAIGFAAVVLLAGSQLLPETASFGQIIGLIVLFAALLFRVPTQVAGHFDPRKSLMRGALDGALLGAALSLLPTMGV